MYLENKRLQRCSLFFLLIIKTKIFKAYIKPGNPLRGRSEHGLLAVNLVNEK